MINYDLELIQHIVSQAIQIGRNAERENKHVDAFWIPPKSLTADPKGCFVVHKRNREVWESWA